MDDKTRIKILKSLLGFGVATSLFNVYVMWRQHSLIMTLCKEIDRRDESYAGGLRDASRYIRKVVEVTQPTPEQIEEINVGFDLDKWEESFKIQP